MNVLRHAATVSFFTALSRALGLLREILMASVFGTSLVKSAFDTAFRIPNLFRGIFGEGALSAAFIPVYNQTRVHDGPKTANQLAGQILSLVTIALSTLAACGMLACTVARLFLAPDGRAETTLRLLTILFPYLLFLCLAAVCMGILNSNNRYAISASAPMLMNLIWIAALALIVPYMQQELQQRITIVAWAVLLSGAAQCLYQAIPIWQNPAIRPTWPRAPLTTQRRKILSLFLPAALATGVRDVNAIVDNLLAFWVGAWAPASLVFAERLIYLPLALFATSFGTVLLPTFSQQAAQDPKAMQRTLEQAISAMLLLMLPAAIGIMILATPLVRLIYEAGQFDARSTMLTARALLAYAPGLVIFSLYKLLVPVFYARQDTRTPQRWAIRAVILNLALNLLFLAVLPPFWRHSGLALATVLSSLINTGALIVILNRDTTILPLRRLARRAARLTACALGMGLLLFWFTRFGTAYRDGAMLTHKPGLALFLVLAVLLAAGLYTLLLLLFCRKELLFLLTTFRQHKKTAGT